MVYSVQFLRFVAAFLVVFHHSINAINKRIYNVSDTLNHYGEFGAVGVHVFFVISGFVIFLVSYDHFGQVKYVPEYFKRRFSRIYPIYWALSLITIVLFLLVGLRDEYEISRLINSLLLFTDSSYIIFVGWTLSYEIFFYCCVGALLLIRLQYALVGLTLLFFGLIAVGVIFKLDYFFTNPLLLEFLAGAWIAVAYRKGFKISYRMAQLFFIFSILVLIVGMVIDTQDVPNVVRWGVPSVTLLISAVYLEYNDKCQGFFQKYAWLGDSSYSLYLVHAIWISVVVQLLKNYVDMSPSYAVLAMIFLMVSSVLLGFLTHTYLEKHLIRLSLKNLGLTKQHS
jgi:exopolysaccharide production protein ExoZ